MQVAEVQHLFGRYREALGASEWSDMCEAFSRDLPSTFWAHPRRRVHTWVADRLRVDGHALAPIPYVEGGYQSDQASKWGRRFEFRAGLIHLQEAASMLPPLILKPKPGEWVLDLCAAPGGKSAQLALQMENTGTLVVNDLSFDRLRALRATQERLGLRNMVLCAQRGETLLRDHPPVFDKVLVDAPCSCEGTLRRRGRWSFEQYNEQFKRQLIDTQRALLWRALCLTRPGGRVVYSTCTLDPEENEGVVAATLETWARHRAQGSTHLAISLETIDVPHLKTSSGLTSWRGVRWSDELSQSARVYPHHNDTGGFFLASFRLSEDPLWDPRVARQSWRPLEVLPSQERARLSGWTRTSYGIDLPQPSALSLFRGNTRSVSASSVDLHTPPTRYQAAGLPIFYTRGAVPRLTSAAALEWGGLAKTGVCELETTEQVDRYYRGATQYIDRSQVCLSNDLDGVEVDVALTQVKSVRGIYIVRYRGVGIGMGSLSEERESLHEGPSSPCLLKSEYPKRIRLTDERSAFESPNTQAIDR